MTKKTDIETKNIKLFFKKMRAFKKKYPELYAEQVKQVLKSKPATSVSWEYEPNYIAIPVDLSKFLKKDEP